MKVKGKRKEITVKEAIRDLLNVNPEGGEVTIDELIKEFPNTSRTDLVAELRNMSNGQFLVGRRGFPSRFIYGKAAKEVAQAVKQRKQHYARDGASHNGATNGRSRNRVAAARDEDMTSELPLRITIGDVGATIPIRVKIAPVEIAAGE